MNSASSGSKIEEVNVSSFTIPTDFPESDGTLEWDKTGVVIVEVAAGGEHGIGYTYASESAAVVIKKHLAEIVSGRDPMETEGAWQAMLHAVRNIGRPGIASCAISAVDNALWDLKARLLELPLAKLLGAVRKEIPVYGSGGFTSYSEEQLTDQLSDWVSEGISMVKMKIGRDPEADLRRVESARKAIGQEAALFVDANGAYTRKQALGFSAAFAELQVSWFEEPVSSDDLAGLHLIRDQGPAGMDIAAGEYGNHPIYFRRMLEAGAVDVLQADATRCGGITGFMKAGALCEAFGIPFSAHTAPSLHAHPCCALAAARHIEYFHDHVRIERMLFDGFSSPIDGAIHPDLSRPGMGLELKRADAERFAA